MKPTAVSLSSCVKGVRESKCVCVRESEKACVRESQKEAPSHSRRVSPSARPGETTAASTSRPARPSSATTHTAVKKGSEKNKKFQITRKWISKTTHTVVSTELRYLEKKTPSVRSTA